MVSPTRVGRAFRYGAILATIILIAACSRTDESPRPSESGAATFVGSSTCQACHAPEYSEWLGSHHQLAMDLAGPDNVLGDFDNTAFDYFGEQTQFLKDGNRFIVRTVDASGEMQDFPIVYTFGVEPLQQYLVEFPGGRLQALPFAWDTRAAEQDGQRWIHIYPDEHIAPDDFLHWTGPQQNWNYMCAECHSTNVVMAYDSTIDSFETSYSEISVGCEACHGPASIHVAEAAEEDFQNSRRGLVADLDDQGRAVWTMNPETGIALRSEPSMGMTKQPEACGRCHSRRSIISAEYEYGQPLMDTHRVSLLDENLYFADGQIRGEVYVYGSFLQSRMYRAGVTCDNCHNPHSLQLVTGGEPDAVCGQCHLATRFEATQHSGHPVAEVGCVDCHMTSRTYMVVDDRRDHSFRVPRPDLTETTSVPNACNSCHTDETAAWAAAAIVEWHGDKRRPEFATALHTGRSTSANALLIAELQDSATPGIARATALSILAAPFGQAEATAVSIGLRDPDPLVRIAALRAHRFMPPEIRLQTGFELLADEIRAVRLDAVLAYADLRDSLAPAAREELRRAALEYRQAQNIILNRPEAHVSLGDLEVAFGNVDAALAHYQDALELEADSVLARVNMADALRRIGDDVRGRLVLEEGIRLNPDDAALHYSLGLLQVRVGDEQAALQSLRRAVQLQPNNPRYNYVLEIAESEIGDAVPD